MTPSIQTLSEQLKTRFQQEGRGLGDGAHYVPGRVVRDMGGMGRMHRFACARCGGRQIVLSSDMILSVFLEEHWNFFTLDIKEYYPLIDIERTQWIAELMELRHPKLRDGSPAMLTTSLLVCRQEADEIQWHAIEIVSSRLARNAPLSAATQIKQEYWRRLGVSFRVVYSEGLNSHRARHLWNLFNIGERVIARGLTGDEMAVQRAILERFRVAKDATLLELCHRTAALNGLGRGDCVAAMWRLIAVRVVECSLDVPELLAQPCRGARICAVQKELR